MKDIEESTKKQQERKAALQRFNKKWNIFQPKHRDQHDDSAGKTDDKGKHEKTNGNLDHSDKSREETTDGNGMGRAKDTKSEQSTEENKATTGDKTEPINNGKKKEQTEKQDNKEPAENSQSGGNETHRNNGKRKERQRAGQDTDGRNAKRKLRRKTVQNTITQYMNTNRSGKRKREHTVHRNKRGEEIGEGDNGQDKEGTKRTRPRQTETTKRKGIG